MRKNNGNSLEGKFKSVCVCVKCGRQNYIKYVMNDCKCVCGCAMLPQHARIIKKALEEFLITFQEVRQMELISMVR